MSQKKSQDLGIKSQGWQHCIMIFFSENKRERGDWGGGGQILVSHAGPSANWLN